MRLLLILFYILFQQTVYSQVADLVVFNANIYNHENTDPEHDAIAVKDGRILALGSYEDIKAYQNNDTKTIDAEGHFLMPGFIEGHGHFYSSGLATLNLDLMGTRNWNEIIELVEEAVRDAAPGEWIEGRGWHQEKWDQLPVKTMRGFPDHDLLSRVAPNNPVALRHASGHLLIANKMAMDLAGVKPGSVSPSGGEIFKDKNGNPTGIFNETAMDLIRAAKQQTEAKQSVQEKLAHWNKCIQKAEEMCLEHGITSFQDAGSTFEQIDRYWILDKANELDIRLWIMIIDQIAVIKQKMETPLHDAETPFFVIGGIKAYIDGALGSRGAWLLEPYSDMPNTHGHRIISEDDFDELARICLEHDLQLCTHAIGDRGNRVVFDTYEKWLDKKDRRWRIEHAQHLNKTEISRFRDLGVIAAMQPIHCTSDAPFVEKRLGKARAEEGAYVWRKILNNKARMNIGTDTPVEAMDPFENIYAACTRNVGSNHGYFYPDQVMNRAEVLYFYTMGNAYSVFQEDEKGSLDPGKLADMILLDHDLMNCTVDEIRSTNVLYTIIDGKIKYDASAR